MIAGVVVVVVVGVGGPLSALWWCRDASVARTDDIWLGVSWRTAKSGTVRGVSFQRLVVLPVLVAVVPVLVHGLVHVAAPAAVVEIAVVVLVVMQPLRPRC